MLTCPLHNIIIPVAINSFSTVQEDAWEEASIQHDSALRLAEVSHTSMAGNSRYLSLHLYIALALQLKYVQYKKYKLSTHVHV